MIGAIIAGVSGIAQGIMGSKKAKKQNAQASELQRQQLALMQEQMNNFKELVKGYPAQTQEFLNKIAGTYADLNTYLEEAKDQGDEQTAAIFQAQRDLVQTHLDAELEAIGANKDQVIGAIQGMSDKAVEIVMRDEDVKDQLRAEYKQEADVAVGNLRKMAEASGSRIDSILKTGMAPDAAAKLSQVRQGVADLTRKTSEFEAARGKGGSASRTTATELEGLKIIGESAAALRSNAQTELLQAGQQQGMLQDAAGRRAQALQPTRGAAELAARSPFMAAQMGQEIEAGGRSLTAMGNANVETRRLTGAEGEASLAREDQYTRDRMSLVQGQNSAEIATKEREQDLISAGTAGQASQARSMADILGVQAQNYANMAKQSQATAQAGWSSAANAGIKMFGAYMNSTPNPNAPGTNDFINQEGYPSPFVNKDAAQMSGYGPQVYGPMKP